MRFAAAILLTLGFATLAAGQVPIVKELPYPKSYWDSGYYKSATPGDFISYVNMKGELHRRAEVTEVGDRQVTLNVTGISNGNPAQSTQILQFKTAEWPTGGGKKKVSRAKLTIAGRELDCELTETFTADGKLMGRLWTSPQVPFDGRVQHEGYRIGPDGKEILTGRETLVDFKFANAPK